MDTIYVIDGAQRTWLHDILAEAEASGATVKVTIHTGEFGGLQVKVGGGCWSPPLGRLDPSCTSGRVRAAMVAGRSRAARCEADAVRGTGTGMCEGVLDSLGQCPRASQHV